MVVYTSYTYYYCTTGAASPKLIDEVPKRPNHGVRPTTNPCPYSPMLPGLHHTVQHNTAFTQPPACKKGMKESSLDFSLRQLAPAPLHARYGRDPATSARNFPRCNRVQRQTPAGRARAPGASPFPNALSSGHCSSCPLA